MKKFMLVLLISTISFRAFSAEQSFFCGSWKSTIAEDYRILESDLTADAAEEAEAFLKLHTGPQEDVVLDFGVGNREKILKGYGLKRAAEISGDPNDIEAFCSWLMKEGFWYD